MSSSNTGTPGGGGRSSPTTAAAAGLGRRTSSGSHPIHDTTNNSGESSSTMTDTTEQAQFLVKLAPRIRRLEATTTQRLGAKMQTILTRLREHQLVVFEQQQQQQQQSNGLGGDGTPNVEADSTVSAAAATPTTTTTTTTAESLENGISSETKQESNSSSNNSSTTEDPYQAFLLLLLGHCMRGLVLLGRCNDVESIFARTAIMPLVRSKVSMGLLDQGGSRGECSGLPRLLHDMLTEIANAYSPVLVLAEAMFATTRMGNNSSNKNGGATAAHCSTGMDVDLLTAGVWVPIATALMTDNAIKMAIFSPGIATILQANYTALDRFLASLARRLLLQQQPPDHQPQEQQDRSNGTKTNHTSPMALYYRPTISIERIQQAQDRIYAHPKTAEFSKKWNLPIYYQLRFGDCCTRLNKAIEVTQSMGWSATAFSGPTATADRMRNTMGFELSLFLELYDVLTGLWKPDVILRPLTNRFLRGAIQLIGRLVSFIAQGMDGTIMFGSTETTPAKQNETSIDGTTAVENGADAKNGGTNRPSSEQAAALSAPETLALPAASKPYCWGDSEEDVAAVAWELTILDSCMRHDYANTVGDAILQNDGSSADDNSPDEREEVKALVREVLDEASTQIHPIIDKAWNEHVVTILTTKCSVPLGAVKGVATTYRMTNRPPPTQASPFVDTILRPLQEFNIEFANRTPDRVGANWKQQIVVTVAERYAAAVEELIATVQRTEVALKNRKARRMASGGAALMSDGEKVKLQLFLDFQTFARHVKDVGVEPATVIGLSKLKELTLEGEKLLLQRATPPAVQNGA